VLLPVESGPNDAVPNSTPPNAAVEVRSDLDPSCPDASEIQRRALDLLLDTEVQEDDRVEADVVVTSSDPSYELSLRLHQRGLVGHRQIRGPTCDELLSAAALIIALAIDPTVVPPSVASIDPPPEPTPPPPTALHLEAPINAVATEPSPEVHVADQATSPTAAAEPPPESRGPSFSMRLGGGAEIGIMHPVAGHVVIGLGPSWRRALLEVTVGGAPPIEAADGSITGRFQLWTSGVRGCPRPWTGPRLEGLLCAGLEAGVMIGQGKTGFSSNRTEIQPWVGAVIGLRMVGWLTARVGLWLESDLRLAFVRPRFGSTEERVLYHAGWVGAAFVAGIAIRTRGPGQGSRGERGG